MRTKKITLDYKVTQKEVIPPNRSEIARKDDWLDEVRKSVPSEWEPKIIRVTYELFNPEIEQQRKFFEGAVVAYYCIQNEDMVAGKPDSDILKRYREDILDEMLGYDYQGVKKLHRMRNSTTDFKTTQAWSTFLQTLEETLFDGAGYIFPDSKRFWDLVKAHGYDEAKKISVNTLQEEMKKRGI
jgi:hypothetical protein